MSIYKHKYFLILLFFINQFIFISCVVAQRNTNTVNNVTRDGDEDLFDDDSGENDKNQGSSDIPYSSGEVLDNSINHEEQTQTQTETDIVSSTSNEITLSTTITKATEKIETSYTIQTATNKDNEPTSISETNTISESQKSSQEIQPTENIEIEPEENIQKIKYESCEDIQPTNGIIDDCKNKNVTSIIFDRDEAICANYPDYTKEWDYPHADYAIEPNDELYPIVAWRKDGNEMKPVYKKNC